VKYELILKNQKLKSYNRISWLVLVLNFFAFVIKSSIDGGEISVHLKNKNSETNWAFIAAIILVAAIIFLWITEKKRSQNKLRFSGIFFLIIFSWIATGMYWLAGLNLLFMLLEIISKRKLAVIFFEEKIFYPSFPKKEIAWNELNNVILKDDLLTMDFKNNKLLQSEIFNSEENLNEDEFNQFCKKQLSTAKNN
jgi:hypothetical protein